MYWIKRYATEKFGSYSSEQLKIASKLYYNPKETTLGANIIAKKKEDVISELQENLTFLTPPLVKLTCEYLPTLCSAILIKFWSELPSDFKEHCICHPKKSDKLSFLDRLEIISAEQCVADTLWKTKNSILLMILFTFSPHYNNLWSEFSTIETYKEILPLVQSSSDRNIHCIIADAALRAPLEVILELVVDLQNKKADLIVINEILLCGLERKEFVFRVIDLMLRSNYPLKSLDFILRKTKFSSEVYKVLVEYLKTLKYESMNYFLKTLKNILMVEKTLIKTENFNRDLLLTLL